MRRIQSKLMIGLLAGGTMLLPATGAFAGAGCASGDACSKQAAASACPRDKSASAGKAQAAGDPYLLDKDLVLGQKIEKAVIVNYQGRELRFASAQSAKTFRADPAKYLARIDQAMIQQQLPYYPLETCVVSGKKLGGEMGEPANYIYKNRLVRFCCSQCRTSFDEDPGKYVAKIDEAVIAAQKNSYPLKTCPVSNEKLGSMGKPANHVAGNRLVQFCCAGCIPQFNKDPLSALAKIDAAAQADTRTAAKGHAVADHSQHNHPHGH